MNNKRIKIVSWNINGFRAIINKGFFNIIDNLNFDILALQETRIQEDQLSFTMQHVNKYESEFAFSVNKKGYSGVALYSNLKSIFNKKGIGLEEFDNEGRVLSMKFNNFVLFCVYFPNGRMNKDRLIYKLSFCEAFLEYVEKYRKQGYSIIIVGDFNTAHKQIDLKNPKQNSKKSGFLSIERNWIDDIIKKGYVDTFRTLHPKLVKYSWWSYRNNARINNSGWRIDYCFVSKDIIDRGWLEDAFINNSILGSDHCPVGIVLRI